MSDNPMSQVTEEVWFKMYADMNMYKMKISDNTQKVSDIMSISLPLMTVRWVAFMTMDVTYTPINDAMTMIPNLDNGRWEIKTQNTYAKYNIMHESWMMEEVAVMLLLVAASIINLIEKPTAGKYSNVFNNAMRTLLIAFLWLWLWVWLCPLLLY